MIFLKKKVRARVSNLVFVLILTLIINPYFAPPIYAEEVPQKTAQTPTSVPTVPANPPAPAPAPNTTTPTTSPTTLGPINPLSPATKPVPQNDTEFLTQFFMGKPPLRKSIFFEQPPGSPGGNPSLPEPLPLFGIYYYLGQGPNGPIWGDASGKPFGMNGADLPKPPWVKPSGFPSVTEGPPLNPVEYIKKQYPFPKPKPGAILGDQIPYTGPVFVSPEAEAEYEKMMKAITNEYKKINLSSVPKPPVAPIVSIGSQLLWGLGVVATFYVVADTVIDLVTHAIVQSYNNQTNELVPGLNLQQFELGLANLLADQQYGGMLPLDKINKMEGQVDELARLIYNFRGKVTDKHKADLMKAILFLDEQITEIIKIATQPTLKPADKPAVERLVFLRGKLFRMFKFLFS